MTIEKHVDRFLAGMLVVLVLSGAWAVISLLGWFVPGLAAVCYLLGWAVNR